MDAVEKAIARHRRSRKGARWYADHWQGPHEGFSAHELNRRYAAAAHDLAGILKRTYSDNYFNHFKPIAFDEIDVWPAPQAPAGLALAAACVVAPGPVDRRGFLARALGAITGAASALVAAPKAPEPEVWGRSIVEPLLRSNVNAEPRPLTEAMMRDFLDKLNQEPIHEIPMNPGAYSMLVRSSKGLP